MSAFSDIFKKAQDAISNLRGGANIFLGRDGDILYSKNNVCVHDILGETEVKPGEENVIHTPGYLSIQCQSDETIGVTLVLQWLPNTTLQKNPASIRSVSPRNHESKKRSQEVPSPIILSEGGDTTPSTEITDETTSLISSPDLQVEMTGDMITVTQITERPTSLHKKSKPRGSQPMPMGESGGLGIPSINLIPNTPVDPSIFDDENCLVVPTPDVTSVQSDATSVSSQSTSGADELSDKEECSSSCDDSGDDRKATAAVPEKLRAECSALWSATPEQFALEHDMILKDQKVEQDDGAVAIARGRAMFNSRASSASLFSVNLGKMRTMRLFFSNPENTSGQLVIATHDSHYKILHFHHGGLDKLAQLFEQWSAIKAKSVKEGSPSPAPDRHLLICQPAVKKNELDPEDGLFERLTWDYWKTYKNRDGSINDSNTVRKAIYFTSMEPSLRREIWPFLLRVYPWESTLEQRETIRNDLFLEYQNIKRKRLKKSSGKHWEFLENTVVKDVVRTDRKNPFYAGEGNPNIDIMRDILLNYAAMYPDVSYIQGMSDLLAPLLSTLRDESEVYWCFVGLMQQTLFVSNSNESLMEQNLEYLRELIKLLVPETFSYLWQLGGDSLQFMFVHRWILLFFKREFAESDALHIWEACWARYRTQYFHLFVCVSIVSIYGPDVISQKLPYDEILLYFSSLAMHMDARVVLKKARGLLHQFVHREKIPCTLAGVVETSGFTQWDSHRQPQAYECVKNHGENEPCPFA
ncbi:unnamed protein product, partial [Mesorhabditis belari]|uniref:Rab-GAP TBC domain-containing protein n=1 Tax=Mesorhabditis belari TaxID=2138241 RepID=A0AAF3EKE5_9BILA